METAPRTRQGLDLPEVRAAKKSYKRAGSALNKAKKDRDALDARLKASTDESAQRHYEIEYRKACDKIAVLEAGQRELGAILRDAWFREMPANPHSPGPAGPLFG